MNAPTRSLLRSLCAALFLGLLWVGAAPAEEKKASPPEPLPPEWFGALTWRSIGPANMSGRIVALAVYEKDPTTYWAATASGGLLKTTNNGVTFTHQFDKENTVSIGDVAVAPSDPNVVWVGTGENNPRNSVSYGDGVYKSADGGQTWQNMGLKKTFQIGRIAIHPENPDIVYVGALGRLYGPNPERGLFKTTDGGKTWEKVLYVDDKTGVIDVQIHPADPDTLLVATWERKRDGYDGGDPEVKWGAGSGIHKTTDGGKTWKKLTKGLPTCKMGRIGLDYYLKDPNVVFAIIDTEKIGTGPAEAAREAYLGVNGEDADGKGAKLTTITRGGPAEGAGLRVGDVVVAVGKMEVKSIPDLLEAIERHKAGDKVEVKLTRGEEAKTIELTFGSRENAPGRGGRPFSASLGGQAANAQDRQGDEGFEYGGVYRSTDGGESWTRINSVNPRPMYFSQVRVDPSDDNYLYVLGVSLAGSTDGGKTFRTITRGIHADQHALWIDPCDGRHMIVGTDGGFYATYDRMQRWDHYNNLAIGQFYHVALDTRANYFVYGGLQDNGSWGGPSRTDGRGPINEDWFSVGGGDGFTCQVDPSDPDTVYATSQYGRMRRLDLRTGASASIAPRGRGYRFNWKTPFILSHKDPKVFYCAANFVFRSKERGQNLEVISPEITTTRQGTGTALSASPLNPNVLWAGTDDGNLWVTRDGGKDWENVARNVGLDKPLWVATIEASRFEEGRAYVCFDGHRSDNDDPHVYATEDFGKTWRPVRSNLPWGSTRCLREDLVNPDLLYCGTEFALYASLDRGGSWTKVNNNLPTVAVHEVALHPTQGELVAATHGRSLWVLDVTPLRQMKSQTLKEAVTLYQPATAIRWRNMPQRGTIYGTGHRGFSGGNPPSGASIYYSLAKPATKLSVKVVDYAGRTVRELPLRDREREEAVKPGLHRLVWDLRGQSASRTDDPNVASRGGRFGGGREGFAGRGTGGRPSGGRTEGGPTAGEEPGRGRPGAGRPEGERPGTGRPEGGRPGGGRTGGGPGGRFGGGGGSPMPPGMYRVVLTVDDQEYSQPLRLESDPELPAGTIVTEGEEEAPEEEEEIKEERKDM